MKALLCLLAAATIALAFNGDDAKDLPDGPGKDVVAKVCIDCHSSASFRKQRLTENEWWDKVGDMVDRGAKADDKQQTAIVAYLVSNFGPGAKVRINTAPQSELIVVLGFTIDESKALIAYRAGHDAFKDWSEVAQVPGVDAKKVEAQKDKLSF
ncbi:MAG TPA: helix-hairpin-helix domain-containing protein [Bryobacteraceae bacterium]|jgi:competence ComEA-like helix-hairpin-helix protein|nr:helix-hairpin-helix domain-containing protein [Bryobacteraceae bacterium]